jgi:endonuclease/exonuclease/phosphatase family metal-dependent hydrolase
MIRVMSFNIRYGLANDGDNHWHNRKELALDRIRAFAPDLLGLQECRDDHQAEFVRANLPDHHFYGIHRGGPGDTALEMAPAASGSVKLRRCRAALAGTVTIRAQ